MMRRQIAVMLLAACAAGGAFAESVSGEWTLYPLTVVVETKGAGEVLGQSEPLLAGENLTLGLPVQDSPLQFSVDPEEQTISLFGDAVPYQRRGDRYVAGEQGMHIEFLFTPIGDSVLCEIVYRWPQFNAVVLTEAIPGEGAAVVPFEPSAAGAE